MTTELSKPPFWQLDRHEFQALFAHPAELEWYRQAWHLRSGPHRKELTGERYERIRQHFDFSLPTVATTQVSSDGTKKLLLTLADGAQVETVLIPFHRKFSICLSSQVGCKVKCTFCRTASMTNFRQLKCGEIVGQYLLARQLLHQHDDMAPNPNVVFMGQGEPLQNFPEVAKAIDRLLDPWAMNLGPRQITLSTAGHLPGLKRWNELHGINLALSLHNAIQSEREQIIPLARQYSLSDIKIVLQQIKLKKRQFITFEYLILKDLNHSPRHLQALIDFCQDLPVIINLIPYNPFPGPAYERPSTNNVEAFKQGLINAGLPVMIRQTKGDDVLAACGQLASDKVVEKRQQIQ